jgi:hypothetical protein
MTKIEKINSFFKAMGLTFSTARINKMVADFIDSDKGVDELPLFLSSLGSWDETDLENAKKWLITIRVPEGEFTASEALYAFCGWLTTREEAVTMSTKHNADIICQLLDKFTEHFKLAPPRNYWEKKITKIEE